ncbi:hypothetical protein BLA29_001480 [Euroglyphus maynei]|uniref:Uncharacterized protein n=1 Tax=Euroglyphus maynei TaxID=6958 RepID=A0A1Y3AWT9_EURMA|nr:hypothetical protein BLA29_001480 [Euroglyphus maynei]
MSMTSAMETPNMINMINNQRFTSVVVHYSLVPVHMDVLPIVDTKHHSYELDHFYNVYSYNDTLVFGYNNVRFSNGCDDDDDRNRLLFIIFIIVVELFNFGESLSLALINTNLFNIQFTFS